MAHIAVVVGHARLGTFCEALGESYCKGAREGGHEAKLFVTSRMHFDPVLHTGFDSVQVLEPDMQAAHDAILAADHLVLIFPLWMSGVPAILKGFLERVLQPDLVQPAKDHTFVKLLKGKTGRVIVTMGMPAFFYRTWFGAYELKILRRCLLGPMGVRPVRDTVLGSIEGVGEKGRRRWLERAEALGRRAG